MEKTTTAITTALTYTEVAAAHRLRVAIGTRCDPMGPHPHGALSRTPLVTNDSPHGREHVITDTEQER